MRNWHLRPVAFRVQKWETPKVGLVFNKGGFMWTCGLWEHVVIFRYPSRRS